MKRFLPKEIFSILAAARSTFAFIMCLQNDDARQASIYSAATSCEIRNVEERPGRVAGARRTPGATRLVWKGHSSLSPGLNQPERARKAARKTPLGLRGARGA